MISLSDLAQVLFDHLSHIPDINTWVETSQDDDGNFYLFLDGEINVPALAKVARDAVTDRVCDHFDAPHQWSVRAGSPEGGSMWWGYSCAECLPAVVGLAQFYTGEYANVAKAKGPTQ